MDFRKIGDYYLQRCIEICQGGYSKLSFSKEEIRAELIERYGLNGNREEVSKLITLCEETIFNFLDPLMCQGSRSFGWPEYHEQELRKKLNTALQIA
jgi:hypothetical protein